MTDATSETILLVEDEPDIAQLVRMNLERSGFGVDWCTTGEEALERVARGGVDLLILDIVLPGGLDGREVCRRLRADEAHRDTPVIMLTSLTEDANIVVGLGAGADDYVKKPFSGIELVARVKAALRRARFSRRPEEASAGPIRHGEIEIDSERHLVSLGGKPLSLTLAEFKLIRHLAAHEGRAMTRQELLEELVGPDVRVIERNVDVHIRNLRRKLGRSAAHLATVRGIGYRFDAVPLAQDSAADVEDED